MSASVGLAIGFLLTLFVYSYLVGDNPLYRLAVHLLVGVSAGYAAVIAWREVVWPVGTQLRAGLDAPAGLLWTVPLLLGLLLFLKVHVGTARYGNVTVGAMMGVGAAVAVTGALGGTLIPQVRAAVTGAAGSGNGLATLVAAVLTACTLIYFQFTGFQQEKGRRVAPRWQRPLRFVGQVVLTITLGALFAGVLATGLVLLTDRVNFFIDEFGQFFSGFLS